MLLLSDFVFGNYLQNVFALYKFWHKIGYFPVLDWVFMRFQELLR